jgi:hypothetical protein
MAVKETVAKTEKFESLRTVLPGKQPKRMRLVVQVAG